jgi:hypothetical protein
MTDFVLLGWMWLTMPGSYSYPFVLEVWWALSVYACAIWIMKPNRASWTQMVGSDEIPRNPPTLPTFGEHKTSYATVTVAEFQLKGILCQTDLQDWSLCVCVCVCVCILFGNSCLMMFGWLHVRGGRGGKMLPGGTTTKGRKWHQCYKSQNVAWSYVKDWT